MYEMKKIVPCAFATYGIFLRNIVDAIRYPIIYKLIRLNILDKVDHLYILCNMFVFKISELV